MSEEFDDSGLPPGWRSGPARISMSKFHDRVVSDYLQVVRWTQSRDPQRVMAQGMFAGPPPSEGDKDAQRRFNDRLHALLKGRIRDARIFEISPDMFIRIDREVDLYITERLAGGTWTPNTIERTPWGLVTKRPTVPEKELRRYARACRRYSADLGVPNPRPFETMWLGLGSMICLGSRLGAMQESLEKNPGLRVVNAPSIVGILINDDCCLEVDAITLNYPDRGNTDLIMLIPIWLNDMWISPELGHPWTLNAIVEVLNQQDTLIQESPVIDKRKFSQRRWWQQQVKKAGIKGTVLPPMYYTVTISSQTRDDDKPKLGMPGTVNWTHRWDVRGHRVTKAAAGPKPIHPLVKRSLLARGYTIIENPDDLTDEQAVILTRHKRSFPSNMIWVAVHIGWRKSFVKGPEDKPYIPASWRLKNESGREQ